MARSKRNWGLATRHYRLYIGGLIFVVYEEIDEFTVYPVTAYEVEG